MTEAEFVAAMREWASGVWARARGTLARTRGSGRLREELARFVDAMRGGAGYKVTFRFPRHGVFRHYGAGRGWVVVNGRPVRGRRVLSLRELAGRRSNAVADSMLARGYGRAEVRRAKRVYGGGGGRPRTPLDWLDGHIDAARGRLADTAAEFYGDAALRRVLEEIDKAKVVKGGRG